MARRVAKRGTDATDPVARSSTLRSPSEPDLFSAALGKRAPFPKAIESCKPTLVDRAPTGPEWLHEIKFDGYRLLAFVNHGRARLDTKNGLDWTTYFPSIAAAVSGLPVESAIIDGEAVVEDERGIPDFGLLQSALGGRAATRSADAAVLYAFDLLYLNGADVREEPLEARRHALADLLSDPPPHAGLRISEHLEGDGPAIWRHACEMGLEGIVSKRRDAPYRSGTSRKWLKTKCVHLGEFVVVGYLPEGEKNRLGALLLATEQDGGLVYAGKVGTGFSAAVARDLWTRLEATRRPKQLCQGQPSPETRRRARWVEPEMVARVAYRGITADQKLRHPVFQGLAG